jgi:hypothetical protein
MSQPSRQPIDAHTPTIQRLRRLSYVLDNAIAIPGTRYRVGLDPILGLLPGAGDFVGAGLSAYIVLEAARLGIPRSLMVQMVTNILFETVAGSVPVVGDLVDVTWKANAKNIALLEEHLEIPRPRQRRVDWLFLALLLGVLLLIVMAVAAISVITLRWLLGAITGG